MRSSSLRCSPAVLVAILTVFSAAQQSESLGDAARRLRSEKQSPSSPTTRQGDTSGGDLASQTASQAFAGPVSKLRLFALVVGGISDDDLVRELRTVGVNFGPDEAYLKEIGAVSGPAIAQELRTATQHLDAAQKEDSDRIDHLLKAAIAEKRTDYRGALSSLKPMLQVGAPSADILFAAGGVLNKLEDFGHSAWILTRVVQLSPDFPYAHGQLSYAYYRMEDGERAVSEARVMVQLRPTSSDAHKFLGLGLSVEGDFSGALREYNEAVRLNPSNAHVYYDIGVLRVDQSNWESAIAAYEKAVKLLPNEGKFYNNLGIALDKAGRLNDAIEAFEKGRQLTPDDPRLLQSYGAVLCNAGRYSQAIPVFTTLLDVAPDWNMARPCLYRSLMRTGRADEAKRVKEDYIKYSPDHTSW